MPEGNDKPSTSSIIAIVNSSLQGTPLINLLAAHVRVRVSKGTLDNSIIFPAAKVSFLMVTTDISSTECLDKITGFTSTFEKSYVFLMSSGDVTALRSIDELQRKIRHRIANANLANWPPNVIPVHNFFEVISSIQLILKSHSQPAVSLMRQRLAAVTNANTLVTSKLVLDILMESLSMQQSDIMKILYELGSISNICTATGTTTIATTATDDKHEVSVLQYLINSNFFQVDAWYID